MADSHLILKCVLVALAVAPAAAGLGWAVVEGIIRPSMIPQGEIERLADDLIARRPGDPETAAFVEEHAAWHRSKNVEQGKWRRVRTAIRARLR